VRVVLGGRSFEFDLGAPFVRTGDAAYPLVGAPYVARDTCFSIALARGLRAAPVGRPLSLGSWRRPPGRDGRCSGLRPSVAAEPSGAGDHSSGARHPPLSAANPITGLRLAHTIVVDPVMAASIRATGLRFPGRLAEKDITLAIGRLLRAELLRRGSPWYSPARPTR